jgi:hypothetical protein
MSKRTANLIVISSHAKVSPVSRGAYPSWLRWSKQRRRSLLRSYETWNNLVTFLPFSVVSRTPYVCNALKINRHESVTYVLTSKMQLTLDIRLDTNFWMLL